MADLTKDLIVKVDPPTPVAIGIAGTCQSCRHWQTDTNPPVVGSCARSGFTFLSNGGFSAYADHVLTHRNFGCNHYEGRAAS